MNKYSDEVIRQVVVNMLKDWSMFDLEDFIYEREELKNMYFEFRDKFVVAISKQIERETMLNMLADEYGYHESIKRLEKVKCSRN